MRPYIKNMGTKAKKLLGEFKGLNTAFGEAGCPDGYAPYMKNISACSYPALKTREGREVIGQFSGEISYLGTFGGKYLFVIENEDNDGAAFQIKYRRDDGQWEYLQNAIIGETGRYNSIYFINKNILVCGAIYTIDGIDKTTSFYITLENGIPKIRPNYKLPYCDFIETVGGRVAVALSKSDKIYLGGIMDSDVWFDIDDGLEVSMITQNCENISAIKTFGDKLICFKPHAFGELYGNSPDNYTLIMASESIGCLEEKTICDCGRLLWLSDEGICSYGGGALPEIISSPVQKYIDNLDKSRISTACAGYDGERYIISLPQKGGGKINLVLNLKTGVFAAEDDTDFRHFTNFNGALYGATAEGTVYRLFAENDEEVSWEWRSPLYKMDIEKKMNLRRIYVDGTFSGRVTLSVINNKGTKNEKTINVSEKENAGCVRFYTELHPKDFSGCESFQIVLKGEGEAEIQNIAALLRKKDITYGG